MLCLISVCQNSIQPVFTTSSADASFVKPSLLQLVMIHIYIADVTCNYYFSHLCVSLTFFVFLIIEHCLPISLNIILSLRSLGQFLPPKSLPSISYASAFFSVWGRLRVGALAGRLLYPQNFCFFLIVVFHDITSIFSFFVHLILELW